MDLNNRQFNPVDIYFDIPIITRCYLTGIILISALNQLDFLGPLDLYFNHRLVWDKLQIWRLITPFLYFGSINFDFIFHLFFLSRYCRMLEEEMFGRKPASFLYMLLLGALIMLAVGPLVRAPFLGTSLTFMIVYVWSRHNPSVLMNFLGIFNFQAPYMPWVLAGFSFLLSGQVPVSDALGIATGHFYYYFEEIFPRLYGWRPLRTPSILTRLLDPVDAVVVDGGETIPVNAVREVSSESTAEVEENIDEIAAGVTSIEKDNILHHHED